MHRFQYIKKICISLIAVILGLGMLSANALSANAYTFTPDVTIHSQAAILYNRNTQQILYEKNADQQQMPGHLAQIMTAIVVMESCDDLDGTTLTANEDLYAPLYRYSEPDDLRYANIEDGDTLTVREYLYALMLTSSCESALILADAFGSGDVNAFVEKMNQKAEELGCTDTTFANPTGLYDAKQVTTARDLLTITNYALEIEGFSEISSTVTYTPKTANLENHPDPSLWTWTHANAMMLEDSQYYYAGTIGIKTGNLNQTGRSIIAEAIQEENDYLVVLLNAPFNDADGELQFYHIEDATNLFTWAFSSFSFTTMLGDDEEIAEVEVLNSDGNSYVLVRPESDCILLWCNDVDTTAVQKVIHLQENTQAPVKAGDPLGSMELKFSGEVIAMVPLVAVTDVDRSFIKFNTYAFENFPHSPWFRYGLIGGAVLSGIYILLCIYAAYRARKNMIPDDPIHLVPHATKYEERPKREWKRSDTVFYHGPDRKAEETEASENRPYEMSGSHRSE